MSTTENRKMCFVITPIGDNNSDIRRHIDGIIDQAIEPALGEKYDIVAAHREYKIGSINDRVIMSVYKADLVIANLTNTNPNVMYELAIRHSFGKPVIVIAEEGTKLPFDVAVENTIFYVNDPKGANELKENLIEYEKHIDSEKKEYGPVYNVVNKIPLYNEVESGGKNVSGEKLTQYIIDRLDSIEKNINLNLREQNMSREVSKSSRKHTILVEFTKNTLFETVEVEKILQVFYLYDSRPDVKSNFKNIFSIFCVINEKDYVELLVDLDHLISDMAITYEVWHVPDPR